jgi:hypothetical protein
MKFEKLSRFEPSSKKLSTEAPSAVALHGPLYPSQGYSPVGSGAQVETGEVSIPQKTQGHFEKFFSLSRCESDSLIAMGHGRMERASHGADGLFRC